MKWQEFIGQHFFSEIFLAEPPDQQKTLLLGAIDRRSRFFSLSKSFTESLVAAFLEHEFSQKLSFKYFDDVFKLEPLLSQIDFDEIEKTKNHCRGVAATFLDATLT